MGNKIKRFFLFCSGASEVVLSQPECAHEHNKYIGIGASVLFTSLFAFLSGGYMLYSILNSASLSLCFGLLWGAIVFNLDRFMVSTLRKRRVAQNLPINERLRQNTHIILSAIPRLLIGVFISVVVAAPFQLKLFEREINFQIAQTNTIAFMRAVSNIRQDFYRINELEHENKKLNEQIESSRDRINTSLEAARAELEGQGGTQIPGAGTMHKIRQDEFILSQAEFQELKYVNRPIIDQNAYWIASLAAKRDALIEEAHQNIQQSVGIFDRLNALEQLSAINPAVRWAKLFILLLFIFLEITPLFAKLISPRGPYDDLLDTFAGQIEGSGVVAERLIVAKEQEQSRSLQLGVYILELILPARDKDYIIGDLLEGYSLT